MVEAEHRGHAVVERVIADLKDQALAHLPSGHFYANAAWTVLAALAHNLLRWSQLLGLPDTTIRAAADVPTRDGYDRDEYPPAVARGKGIHVRGVNPRGWMADVAYVPSSENRSHGSRMGIKIRRFCNGTRFRYVFY